MPGDGYRRMAALAEVPRDEWVAARPEAMDTSLTPHKVQVFVALAPNQVPIDVLAERLDTTRGFEHLAE